MPEPELKTERLILRPLRAADARHIELYVSDKRVASMTTSIPHPYPPGSAESFIARTLSEDEEIWAMEHVGSAAGELVGVITLRPNGEIGYWVGAPFWDTGFATEAVEAVVAYAFANQRDILRANVFQDNPASAKVLTKVGFSFIGEDESFSIARNGAVPVWVYEQTPRAN